MKRPLDIEQKVLKKNLIKMGELVEASISKSIKALTNQDEVLAREVIDSDKKINKFEIKNEKECLKLIALYQPAAIDLRFLTMALKINNDLERMADLAVNIAERAIDLKDITLDISLDKINEMAEITGRMVKGAVASFINKDAKLAEEVSGTDDQVDALNEEIFADLLTKMAAKPYSLKKIVALLFISKYIERIADHADNIGEDVVYIAKGKSPKHH